MKIAIFGDKIYLKNSKEEYPIIKSLPNARFDKKILAWEIPNTLDMLERLKRFVKLPPAAEAERKRLKHKQDCINAERLNQNPKPLCNYPVKVSLFQHQIRGANMAMYALELLEEQYNDKN